MAASSPPTEDRIDRTARILITVAAASAVALAAVFGALWPMALALGAFCGWMVADTSTRRLRSSNDLAHHRVDELGALLTTVMATDPERIVVRDPQGTIVDANAAADQLLAGWPEHPAIAAIVDRRDGTDGRTRQRRGPLRGGHPTSEASAEVVRMARDYGEPVEQVVLRPSLPVSAWLSVSAYPVDTTDGRLVMTVFEDVSSEIRAISELQESSEVDELTGVGNRRNLERSIRAFESTTGSVGVILVDFDAFKALNDRYGHLVGDEVLREAGSRLRLLGRPGDVVARLGGDEFVVLIPGASSDAIEGLVDRVEGVLTAPFVTTAGMVTVGCSVGSAIGDASAVRRHVNHADNQMYERKRAGVIGANPIRPVRS